MIIGGKYELASVVAETAEWRTYSARDAASGRAVLAHQIIEPCVSPAGASLRDLLRRVQPAAGVVIEILTEGGRDFVVTQSTAECEDLRALLEKAASSPLPSKTDRFTRVGVWRVPDSLTGHASPAETAPSSATGVFSSHLLAPDSQAPESQGPAKPESACFSPTTAPVEAAIQQPAQERGGFTAMFQASAPETPPAAPSQTDEPEPLGEAIQQSLSAEPASGASVASPMSRPGEFTAMFRGPAQEARPSATLPPETTVRSGEFTMMFQSAEPVSTAPSVSPPDQPGEFTALFRAQTPPGSPADAAFAQQSAEPGEFTRMFKSAEPASTPSQPGEFTAMFQMPVANSASAAPAAPSASAGPGVFTSVFQTPATANPVTPQPAVNKPGEFTQFFQSAMGPGLAQELNPPAAQEPTPLQVPQPGEYTRLFQMPSNQPQVSPAGGGATGVFVTPSAQEARPSIPVEDGPSDFTRMVQAPPRPGAEASQSTLEAPQAVKQGPPLFLVALLAALAVIAIGMVLFFVLRR
jgi:hypothetical protein